MWSRLRLDIGWPEIGRGMLDSLLPVNRESCREKLESGWSGGVDDAMACLCVRSGFDLVLQALDLPKDSEILFSALTIADMPRVAIANGLIPVPVDVGPDFHINASEISRVVTEKSRVLVIAHLFGARGDLTEVLQVAREHDLFVIEDCAQAFCGPQWRGTPGVNTSLFSFGTIKTMTAFGGALCRSNDGGLLKKMSEIEAAYPVRSRFSQFIKIAKFALMKVASTKLMFGWLTGICGLFNKPVDELLRGFTRAFPPGELVTHLRYQTDGGTLRLLARRMRKYDPSRVRLRKDNAGQIIARLGLGESQPGLLDKAHCFWLFPLIAENHQSLMTHLRSEGFDSTQRGALVVVETPIRNGTNTCPVATDLLEKTVFLPCYPELSSRAIDEMCDAVISLR